MTTLGFLVVELLADSSFCIAATENAEAHDRPMALHPLDDSVIVPASSLIGSLRAHTATSASVERADQLFGQIGEKNETKSSVVRALGVVVRLRDQPVGRLDLERRSQTAIDGRRGSAKTNSLRHSQTAPAGIVLRLYLEVRDADVLNEVGSLVASWCPTIGGGRSVGLGVARVVSVNHGVLDLSTDEGLLAFLSYVGPELVEHVARDTTPITNHDLTPIRSWTFELTNPLLVRGEREGNNMHALLRNGKPVIDGSSWKGVFRHRAEHIVASIARQTGRATDPEALDLLFGTLERRGWLVFPDTTISGVVADAPRPHVSIDRVTGGARAERLFTDQPVETGSVRLSIWSSTPVPDWVGVLLDAIVADIADGLVGIGGNTSRGYGSLTLAESERPTSDVSAAVEHLLVGQGVH